MAIPKRQIGGLSVSALGLGCMGMSQSYGPRDDAVSSRTLNQALDRGLNFFDTANVYGSGHNESLIGQALSHRRQEFVLATKVALRWNAEGSFDIDASPARIKVECEASLKRLKTDVIDLYYLHRLDANTPIEESVGAMADLVKAGKVRYLGLSELMPEHIRRAAAVHPIAALQSEWSLWSRDIEAEILPLCRDLNIALVPFSPLGRGFLTATIEQNSQLTPDDMRHGFPRFSGDNLKHNLGLVAELKAIAGQVACTPAQLALAWLLAQGEDVVPIPGTRNADRLAENMGACQVQLSPAVLQKLSSLFSPGAAAGSRYPDKLVVAKR